MRFALLLVVLGFSAGIARAQVVQLQPFVGWTMPSSLDMSPGYIRFSGAANVGFNLSLGMGPSGFGFFRNVLFELHYNHFVSDMLYRFDADNISEQPMGNVTEHALMIGCTKEAGGKKWAGYGGLYFGVVSMAPQDIFYNTRTRFTMGFGGGIKHAINDKIGLRLNTQIYVPIWKSGYYSRWSIILVDSGVVTSSLQAIANISLGMYFNLVEIR